MKLQTALRRTRGEVRTEEDAERPLSVELFGKRCRRVLQVVDAGFGLHLCCPGKIKVKVMVEGRGAARGSGSLAQRKGTEGPRPRSLLLRPAHLNLLATLWRKSGYRSAEVRMGQSE